MAIPLPAIITRWHTAAAITSTSTYTTSTTTVWLPPVEIFISNGVTYTFTRTEGQWATTPVTQTSVYNDATSTQAAGQQENVNPTTETASAAQGSQATTTIAPNVQTTSTVSSAQISVQQSVYTSTFATQTASVVVLQGTASSNTQSNPNDGQNGSSQSSTTTTATAFTTVAATSTTTTTTSAAATVASSSSSSSSSSGTILPPSYIVYSPYADDDSCKTYDVIQADLKLIQSKGINRLRIYSTDCATLTAVLPLAKSMGMKINQGFWISDAGVDSIDLNVSNLITWASSNGWDLFDFITIGNEAVLSGYCTVTELIDKIASVKAKLNKAGWTGQVTTSETPSTYIAHPELCTESVIDFVGINSHAYYNTNLYAYQAGSYITSQQVQIEALCSKSSFITETGYPHKGDTNGNNVPSAENQYLAVKSIIEATAGNVTILTTYDDLWKLPGSYGVEQYFGAINLF